MAILVLSSAVLIYLIRLASPYTFEFDVGAKVAREAAWDLEDCLYTFLEIGELLAEDQLPDASLRCPNTVVDNVIRRSGDDIRVSHPNPAAFGLRELYVTNQDHRPVVR